MTPRLALAGSALRALATPAGHVRAANVLLALAAATLVVAGWRAVRLDPLPAATAPAAVMAANGAIASRGPRSASDQEELDNDPFRIDRQLPEMESPADEAIAVADVAEPAIVPEMIRLLGTVVLPGARSFVIYQLPSQVPRTLRAGESIGRLRLESIVPGQAGFRAADGTRVTLQLPKPGG
jgi:hypothetical protein